MARPSRQRDDREVPPSSPLAAVLHSWTNSQKPAKVKVEKFVKLTDHICVCNDLTSFECEAQLPGNGSYVNLR